MAGKLWPRQFHVEDLLLYTERSTSYCEYAFHAVTEGIPPRVSHFSVVTVFRLFGLSPSERFMLSIPVHA